MGNTLDRTGLLGWTARFVLLYFLFSVCFLIGAAPLAGVLPDAAASEPGLVSATTGLLVIALVNTGVVAALILTSRWTGWTLAASLAFAFYGAVTFLSQVETWYFLSSITVDRRILPRLFLMGVPPAFLFVPIAVWVLGKGRARPDTSPNPALVMPASQWAWKLAALALAYVALYWTAGYFIAWQNPQLRAFYGQPGPPLPFVSQTINTLRHDPILFLLQIGRGLVWVLCALPIIRGSRAGAWGTALLVGLLFSAPQNVGQIIANPLMPIASVRLSHLVETASSTFVFGLLVAWLLHRGHRSAADLIGRRA